MPEDLEHSKKDSFQEFKRFQDYFDDIIIEIKTLYPQKQEKFSEILNNLSTRNKKRIFGAYLSSQEFGKIPNHIYTNIIEQNKDNKEQKEILESLIDAFTIADSKDSLRIKQEKIKRLAMLIRNFILTCFLTITGCQTDNLEKTEEENDTEYANDYFMPPYDLQEKENSGIRFTEKYPELTKSLLNQFSEKYKLQNNFIINGEKYPELQEAEKKFKNFVNQYASDLDTVINLKKPYIKYYQDNDSSVHNAFYNGGINMFGTDTLDNFIAEISHHLMNDMGDKRQAQERMLEKEIKEQGFNINSKKVSLLRYSNFRSVEFQAHSLVEEAIYRYILSSPSETREKTFEDIYREYLEIFDFSIENSKKIEQKYDFKDLHYPIFKIIYNSLIEIKRQSSQKEVVLDTEKIVTNVSKSLDIFLKKYQETKKILDYETNLNFKNYLYPDGIEKVYYEQFIETLKKLTKTEKYKKENSEFSFFTDELIFEINFYHFILTDYLLNNKNADFKEKNLFLKNITEQLLLKLKDKVKNNFNNTNFTNIDLNIRLSDYSREIENFLETIKTHYSYENLSEETFFQTLKKESLITKSVMQIYFYSDPRGLHYLWSIIENNELVVPEKNKNDIKIFLTEIIPEMQNYAKEDMSYQVVFKPDKKFYQNMNNLKNKLDNNFYKKIIDRTIEISRGAETEPFITFLKLEKVFPDTYKFLNGID